MELDRFSFLLSSVICGFQDMCSSSKTPRYPLSLIFMSSSIFFLGLRKTTNSVLLTFSEIRLAFNQSVIYVTAILLDHSSLLCTFVLTSYLYIINLYRQQNDELLSL